MNARQEYERLAVELHREIRAGHGDADAADGVRDRMDGSWPMLSGDEQNTFGLLSEDLYELAGDRQLVELAADENLKSIAKRIKGSYARQPARTLALLRKLPDDQLTADVRAYMMGRCWARLGFHYAATEFFDYAYSLIRRANYAVMALSAVADTGDIDELNRRITEIEENSEAAPALCLHARALLFQTAQKSPESVRPSIFRRVITLVGRGTSSPDTLPSLRATALVAAGFSYEHLSQRDRALASLDKAIETFPHDSAFVARALLRLASDREAGAPIAQRFLDVDVALRGP